METSRLPWLAVGAALAALLWHSWYGPDIWSHLFLGRGVIGTLSAQPADHLLLQQPSYLNVYWLFQVVLYGIHRVSGTAGVTLFFLVVWFLIFFLWGRTSRLFEVPLFGLPLALLAVLACQIRFEERPDVLSWLILSFQIAVISARPDPERPLSSLPLVAMGISQVLWTNVHGYFFLGPAVALLRLVTSRAPRLARRSLFVLFFVQLLASFVSPFGAGAWIGVFRLGRLLDDLRFAIDELGPPLGSYLGLWTVWIFWSLWALTAMATARALLRPGRDLFPPLLAIAGLFLSATSLRNIPAVVVFAGPVWAALVLDLRRVSTKAARAMAVVVSLVALLLVAWTVQGGFHRSLAARVRFGTESYGHAYPVRFAEYLRGSGFSGSIFNHPSDGGYLEFHFPELRLYGDSRFTEPTPVREYFEALFDRRSFLRLDARHRFDAVLVNLAGGQDPLLQLLETPGWKLAYADLHRAFLVHVDRPAARSAVVRPPRFVSGEDLSNRLDGYCAIRWTYALARLDRADHLLALLRQLGAASQVPSPVLQIALEYALRHNDTAILDEARALHSKMLALTNEDAAAVNRLLERALRH